MDKNCKPNIVVPDKYSVVVVQNITERNDISCKLRQNGMIAIVVEEGYAQYQIQTQEGFYGVCDNNAWVQIETGDRIFDGNNLIIINNEEHKREYLSSPLAKVGQMIFYVPENKYYKYNGVDFVDPFLNKLDKPLDLVLTINPDNKLIPVYGQSGDNPEWLPSNTLGKVESVNNIGVSPGTKNIELKLSDIPDDVGYATDAELTQLSRELDVRITQVEGINYTWSPTNRTLTLFDASGREMSQVSLVSLDNEGTDLRYNSITKSLELYNADNQLLDSIPVVDFVGNVGTALQLNSNVLQLKDSQGNVLSSVSFSISNISGLQTALDAKEPTLTAGTSAQYYRGDKTWQVLDKSAVGLSNVDNTSDINKPVSTAQAAAIATKLDKTTTTVASPDSSFKYVYLTDETNNVRRMLAGDLGKNVANSSLTSVAGAGLKLGSSWTLNTNGQLYSVTNLPDKSADIAFQEMLVQNSSGQVARGNGKFLAKTMPSLLSDAEKTNWKTEMNGGWTTANMSIFTVFPNVINANSRYSVILLRGANLNVNPATSVFSLINTTTLVEIIIPNANVNYSSSSNGEIWFWYDFSTLPEGYYAIRIFNGVAQTTTSEINNILISSNLSSVDTSIITWDKKAYTPGMENEIFVTGSNSLQYRTKLNNIESSLTNSIVAGSVKSSLIFTKSDNFTIKGSINVTTNHLMFGGSVFGLVNSSSTNDLLINSFISIKIISGGGNWVEIYKDINETGSTIIHGIPGLGQVSLDFIISKRGNMCSVSVSWKSRYDITQNDKSAIYTKIIPDVPISFQFAGIAGNSEVVSSNVLIEEIYKY